MKKIFQIVFGVLFIALGALMLIALVRNGSGNSGGAAQAVIGPLVLISAGALVISHAQRKPKKW